MDGTEVGVCWTIRSKLGQEDELETFLQQQRVCAQRFLITLITFLTISVSGGCERRIGFLFTNLTSIKAGCQQMDVETDTLTLGVSRCVSRIKHNNNTDKVYRKNLF